MKWTDAFNKICYRWLDSFLFYRVWVCRFTYTRTQSYACYVHCSTLHFLMPSIRPNKRTKKTMFHSFFSCFVWIVFLVFFCLKYIHEKFNKNVIPLRLHFNRCIGRYAAPIHKKSWAWEISFCVRQLEILHEFVCACVFVCTSTNALDVIYIHLAFMLSVWNNYYFIDIFLCYPCVLNAKNARTMPNTMGSHSNGFTMPIVAFVVYWIFEI